MAINIRRVLDPVMRLASAALLVLAAGGCAHTPRSQFQTAQFAAAKRDAHAEYHLAECYARGEGVPQDYVRAVEYLRKSAEQGYAYAETDLGSYYARGVGVPKDFAEALVWYRKAAAQGDTLAEYCIGYAYSNGDGVPKDFDEAVQWWQKSAMHGQVDAQNALGQFYFHGEFPGDTNHINYAESARWLRRAAGQGCVAAMNNLGILYQQGLGVKQNFPMAAKWYSTAAQTGEPMAEANLGLMYQDGDGVPHDMVQAYKWFMLSAEQGNVVGRHYLEDYNEHHRLTPDQLAEAKRMVAEFHDQLRKQRWGRRAAPSAQHPVPQEIFESRSFREFVPPVLQAGTPQRGVPTKNFSHFPPSESSRKFFANFMGCLSALKSWVSAEDNFQSENKAGLIVRVWSSALAAVTCG